MTSLPFKAWIASALLGVALMVALADASRSTSSRPCFDPSYVPPSLENSDAYWTFYNFSIKGVPKANGVQIENTYISLNFYAFHEIECYNYSCQDMPPVLSTDPHEFATRTSGRLVQSFVVDTSTTCSWQSGSVDIGQGQTASTLNVTFTWGTQPLSIKISLGLYDGPSSVPIQSWPASSSTLGQEVTYAHVPHQLKISLEVTDWPWGPNPSSLIMQANFTELSYQSIINPTIQPPTGWYFDLLYLYFFTGVTVPNEGTVNISVILQQSCVTQDFDGVLTARLLDTNASKGDTIPTTPPGLLLYTTFSFANDLTGLNGTHFSYIWYDPSIEMLFTPSSNPSPPDSVVKIVAPVVVIGVVVIVAILVILVIKVPAFKRLVRPFQNRKREASHSSQTVSRQSERQWTKGTV